MLSFEEQIHSVRGQFSEDLSGVSTAKEVEALRLKYLGKKGAIQKLLQELGKSSPEERPLHGKSVNALKEEVHASLEEMLLRFSLLEQEEQLAKEWIDPTLPGRSPPLGKIHPVQQMLSRVVGILKEMGFVIRLGPDVDTDAYNFEGLNFPPNHPARDMQDTFYFSDTLLLRTHTSNVQVHSMEEFRPPMRIAAPGRCFRNEDISARSHVFFHQVELFYIDTHVSLADLLATLEQFLAKFFGEAVKTRFRPSYFPFVEPGIEVDVSCRKCSGQGCRLCKHTGWLEILGAGMIHPNVLKKRGIDPEVYSGYAAGLGIERLALLQADIPDIRLFTENDVRFLAQFPS